MKSSIETAVVKLQSSQPIVLVDDVARVSSGYLVAKAQDISAEDVSFMVNYGRSVICAAVDEDRIAELGLSMMPSRSDTAGPEQTISVESRQGVTTGISAADRAKTLHTVACTTAPKVDLVTPGHIFPVLARRGGVLVRNSVSDAAVDLLRLANLTPVAAYCHCLNEQGDIANEEELSELVSVHQLATVMLSDIVRHRLSSESIVEQIAEAELPTKFAGDFRAVAFRSNVDGAEHLALVKGDLQTTDSDGLQEPVLVRVQAENRVGDLLSTTDLFRRPLILGALRAISDAGRGVFVYVRHPCRGALEEQVRSMTTGETKLESKMSAQLRELGTGAQILTSLGARRLRILSNSSRPIAGVDAFQIEIVDREQFEPYTPSPEEFELQ